MSCRPGLAWPGLRLRGEVPSSVAGLLRLAAGMSGGHVQRRALRERYAVQWVDVAEYTTVKPDSIVMHQPHRVLRVLSATAPPTSLAAQSGSVHACALCLANNQKTLNASVP